MMEKDLRDELSSAFDTITATEEKPEEGKPDEKVEEIKPDEQVEAPKKEEKEEEKEEEKGKSEEKGKPEEKPKKKEDTDQLKKEEAPEEPKKEEKVEPVSARAPGSWKPAARELWAKIPPDAQREILRREREINKGMTEVSEAKQFTNNFGRMLQPHTNMIAAEGGDPVKVINNLLNTASGLYYGVPTQKANIIAGFIKTFGVDVAMLDSILAGTLDKGGNGTTAAPDFRSLIQAEVRNATAPLLQTLQSQQQNEEKTLQEALDDFAADPANEFYEDVRETMADLLEVAAKRGQKMDLPTAYARATMMHTEIAEIINERTLQKKADEATARAVAARKKAVSITGAPAKEVTGASGSGSLRDDLQSSIDSLS